MKDNVIDKQLWVRRGFLLLLDIILINLASWCAIVTRFDFRITNVDVRYAEAILGYTLIHTVLTLLIFFVFRLYHSMWRFASVEELAGIIVACILTEIVHVGGLNLYMTGSVLGLTGEYTMPRSFWPLDFMYLLIFIGGSRFFYRALRFFVGIYRMDSKKHIMVIGAGAAAAMLIKEIGSSQYLDGKVVCAIDDDRAKLHSFIQGVKVVGNRQSIGWAVQRYNVTDIIIAIPSLSKKELKTLIDICKETGCKIKTLPGLYQLINGEVSVSQLKNVEIEDLLGRDTVNLDTENVMDYVRNKVVMVTGGGGSIGSELCRQIAAHQPKQLIIIEIYENNAYDIQQELRSSYPELDLVVLIASVRNTNRMEEIFDKYRPELVYHAAAHKHVPLMEDSPNEAIKNNVYGTLKLVRTCDKFGVKRFVQISTDKAVNPTNVMGASKRMCEMIIQAYDKLSATEFVAVRFGNVLGSNGSVIPLFKKQLAKGGPLTVTHPDIIRYFMTIPEAVSLVLQAGALAKGGEIFVLDMGEPVKIDDLARNLIRLSGYVPDRDIEIKYTGLRPGEKLYEELLMDEEGIQDTENQLIHIGKPIEFDEQGFLQYLDDHYEDIVSEKIDVREFVKKVVPTYRPKN